MSINHVKVLFSELQIRIEHARNWTNIDNQPSIFMVVSKLYNFGQELPEKSYT